MTLRLGWQVALSKCHFNAILPVHFWAAAMDFPLLLDPDSPLPLHQQVYRGIRGAVLSGRLSRGQRLPSTRALAALLEISRTTATLACDQLVSEGYLEARRGSGTYVCAQLPEDYLAPALPDREGQEAVRPTLSGYGRRLEGLGCPEFPAKGLPYDFSPGRPALDAFPMDIWSRLLTRQCREGGTGLLGYAEDPAGHAPLREALADYLRRSRAVRCEADQVIVVTGCQQAIDLAARVLVDPGATVALEDPGYPKARRSFLAHGARIQPLPVGDDGLELAGLKTSRPRLVYLTPSHQYPTGLVLDLPRRLELLTWAGEAGALIFEDDYDSEFRFGGRPLPAMQGLDGAGTVLYSGTFSKVLFPALRLGYLVAPRALAGPLSRALGLLSRQPPTLEQATLADFIREGHLERHLRRMRTLYGARREALVEALAAAFGDRVSILGAEGGMHLLARFVTQRKDQELVRLAAELGVALTPASGYYLDPAPSSGFIFGFAALTPARIREGIRRLATVLA